MGLYDRDYTQENYRSQFSGAPQMRFVSAQLSPVVKWLLIVNAAVFLATFLMPPVEYFTLQWFSVYPTSVGRSLQLWRLITYQFLHGSPWHLFVNMLALFFFGPMLERSWGGRKFLAFYLLCGMTGGLVYPLLVLAGWLDAAHLVGRFGVDFGNACRRSDIVSESDRLRMGHFPSAAGDSGDNFCRHQHYHAVTS